MAQGKTLAINRILTNLKRLETLIETPREEYPSSQLTNTKDKAGNKTRLITW
jgi:hypothetical protein